MQCPSTRFNGHNLSAVLVEMDSYSKPLRIYDCIYGISWSIHEYDCVTANLLTTTHHPYHTQIVNVNIFIYMQQTKYVNNVSILTESSVYVFVRALCVCLLDPTRDAAVCVVYGNGTHKYFRFGPSIERMDSQNKSTILTFTFRAWATCSHFSLHTYLSGSLKRRCRFRFIYLNFHFESYARRRA